jgi:carbonic anhydrase
MNIHRSVRTRTSVLACAVMVALPVVALGQESDWAYDEATGRGPSQWGQLASDYQACREGLSQSPVDLGLVSPGPAPALQLRYSSTPLIVENNGHTIEVVIDEPSELRVAGQRYRLRQFHFHTPSEHQIAGASYPLEVHFVHASATGELAVLGMLFREGAANPVLEQILLNAPAEEGENHVEGASIEPRTLLPRSLAYRAYAGSLTTPPCSEGVRWIVLQGMMEASAEQIDALRETLEHVAEYPLNARPVQSLNGRSVTARGGR